MYRYDERGNLVEQVRSIRLDQQTLLDRVTYRYDAANQLLEIGYPSGLAIGYPRNAGGQVASVTLAVGDKAPSTLVGQIAYLPFGPLLRLTWGNGIALSREYDQDYQLLRQKVGPWQSDYQHDANGNIQQHRHSLWGTLDYQYDPLDRLTEEHGVQGGRSYAYDAVGNRTQRSDNPASGGTASSQDYQYAPDSNRLTAIGAQAVTSDAAGNLTQDRAARKLAYDAQGRLQSVSRDGQQVAEYRYNALGQRIVKLTPRASPPTSTVPTASCSAKPNTTAAAGNCEPSTTCGWTACRWPPSTPTTTPRARSATRPCSTSMATTSTPRAWPPMPAARSPGSGSPTPSAAAKR